MPEPTADEMLDWMQEHYTKFRENGFDDDERHFTLDWLSGTVTGESLRDCVTKAMKEE